jgi:glucan phosphoethanolaminetransferase (alkaline phosphatase superfamily)
MHVIAFPSVIKFIGGFSFVFLLLELLIRSMTGLTDHLSFVENILISVVFALLVFYATTAFKRFLSLFLLTALLVQAANAVFYGGWIDPMNLYLLFENITEVAHTALYIDSFILLKALLFSVLSVIAIVFLYRMKQHHGLIGVNFLIVIVLLFQPLRDGFFKPEKIEKRFTKDSHSLVRSFHNAYGVFFSMLISEHFGSPLYPAYRQVPYAQTPPDLMPDIFIYFGESLSTEYMSLYGYPQKTTPYLTQLVASLPQNNLFGLSKKTIAGATATMPATVRFFHMINQPDGRKQAASFDTNLFRYAKNAGYKTTYFSTQAENFINHIYKLAAGNYADRYLSPTQLDQTNSTRTEMDDATLVEVLKTFDFSTPSFVVLQPNGSHTPFTTRCHPELKRFGMASECSEYENSVFYTDTVLHHLLETIQAKTHRPWVFIITSDHGSYVDDTHITRSIKYPASYSVPAIILTNNKSLYQQYIQPLADCNRLYHQHISEMIATLLGVTVPARDCQSGVLFIGLLNGMGAKAIQISESGTVEMKPYRAMLDGYKK